MTDENRLDGRARRATRRILELVKKVREAAMLGFCCCVSVRGAGLVGAGGWVQPLTAARAI